LSCLRRTDCIKTARYPLFNHPLLQSFPNTSRRSVAWSRYALSPYPTNATSIGLTAAEKTLATRGLKSESSISYSIFDTHEHPRRRPTL